MVAEDPGPSVPRPKRRIRHVPDAIGAESKKRKGNGHTRGGDYSSRTDGLDSSDSVETISGRKGRGCLYCSVSLQDLDPSVPILPQLGDDSTCAHGRYAVVICGRRDMTFTRLLGGTAGSCWMTWPMIQLPDDPVTKSKRFHRSKFVDPPPRTARCIQANDARRVLRKAMEPVGSPVLKVHLKTKMVSADPKEPRSHGSLPILLGLVKLIDVTKKQQEKIMKNNPLMYECFQQSDVIERSQQQQDEMLVLQEDEVRWRHEEYLRTIIQLSRVSWESQQLAIKQVKSIAATNKDEEEREYTAIADDEHEDCMSAREQRKGPDCMPSFKEAVYKAACHLILEVCRERPHKAYSSEDAWQVPCTKPKSSLGCDKLYRLFGKLSPSESPEDLVQALLDRSGCSSYAVQGVRRSHIIGEALELIVAHAYFQYGDVEMRDYLEEKRRDDEWRVQRIASTSAASMLSEPRRDVMVFKQCSVRKVFISSSWKSSPFCMTDEDGRDLREALSRQAISQGCTADDGHILANEIIDQARTDHGIDVIVWVTNHPGGREGAESHHFLMVQCKARTNFNCSIKHMGEYVGKIAELREKADKVKCLVPLVLATNLYDIDQLEWSAFPESFRTGKLLSWTFREMCEEDKTLKLFDRMVQSVQAALRDAKLSISEKSAPNLKEHQQQCLQRMQDYLKEGMERDNSRFPICGVASLATGAGKSFLAAADMLEAEKKYPDEIGCLPSLWLAPTIQLVLQDAHSCRAWESSRPDVTCRPFYYVICSAKRASTGTVRVIEPSCVVSTLRQHHVDGSLSKCRFFCTVEGSAFLWSQVLQFIYTTHGYNPEEKKYEDPFFGTFIRDEVHVQCGINSGCFSLGLNIPAVWCPSYTATPTMERDHARMIRKFGGFESATLLEQSVGSSEDQEDCLSDGESNPELENVEDEDEDDDDDDEDEGTPSAEERQNEEVGEQVITKEELMYNGNIPIQRIDAALHKKTVEKGLAGIMLLSKSMTFEVLSSERDGVLFELVQEVLQDSTGNSSGIVPQRYHLLESRLSERMSGKRLVVFPMEPLQCEENEAHMHYVVKFNVQRKNYLPIYPSKSDVGDTPVGPDAIVLGEYKDDKGQVHWAIQRGPMRGPACHDCTPCGYPEGMNYVGPVVCSYTFRECFAHEPKLLASPALSVLGWEGLPNVSVPQNSQDESGNHAAWNHAVQRTVLSLFGMQVMDGNDEASSHLMIHDPKRVFFQIYHGEETISVSLHDVRCMAMLLDMFARSDQTNSIRKPIVFCADNKTAGLNLRLFKILRDKKVEYHEKNGEEDLASLYRQIGCAHVYQSQQMPIDQGAAGSHGDERSRLEIMDMSRRQRLIGNFLTAERFVLFNVDLLSTGIDLPCCDAVFIHTPMSNATSMIQRWGRSLRLVPGYSDKYGTLILPCSDPYAIDDPEMEQFESLFGAQQQSAELICDKRDSSQFHGMCYLACCCVDEQNLGVRTLLDVMCSWKTAASMRAGGRRSPVQSRLFGRDGRDLCFTISDTDLDALVRMTRSIGIVMNSAGQWLDGLNRLVQWRSANPQSWPKKRSSNPEERRAGSWLASQRRGKRKMDCGLVGKAANSMTADRAALLDEKCPGWFLEKDPWSENVEKLAVWRAMNPNKWPSKVSKDPEEKALGLWLSSQRTCKKNMDQGKTSAKELLGMDPIRAALLDKKCRGWTNDPWENQLEKLLEFRMDNKWPCTKSKDPEERKNASWLSNQRQCRKKMDRGETGKALNGMTAARARLLDEKCPGWLREKDPWTVNLDNLAKWCADHPKEWPNPKSKSKEERKLANWLVAQRSSKRKMDRGETGKTLNGMTAARARSLDDTCPGWIQDKDPWTDNLNTLVQWRQKNPSRWPSQSAQEQAERKVGGWLSDQVKYKNRMERGTGPLKGMTPERIAILDKECPGWSSRT